MIKRRLLKATCIISLIVLFGYAGWAYYWRSELNRYGEFHSDKSVFVARVNLTAEERVACAVASHWEKWFHDSSVLVLPLLMTTALISGLVGFGKPYAKSLEDS